MTTLPAVAQRQTATRRPASYEEYLLWASETRFAEWADGEIIEYMPPLPRHQEITWFLFRLLSGFVEALDVGWVGAAPLEFKLWPDGPSREPDAVSYTHLDVYKRQQPAGDVLERQAEHLPRLLRKRNTYGGHHLGQNRVAVDALALAGQGDAEIVADGANGHEHPAPGDPHGDDGIAIELNFFLLDDCQCLFHALLHELRPWRPCGPTMDYSLNGARVGNLRQMDDCGAAPLRQGHCKVGLDEKTSRKDRQGRQGRKERAVFLRPLRSLRSLREVLFQLGNGPGCSVIAD